MGKKRIWLLLLVLLLLAGCQKREAQEEEGTKIELYYLNREETRLIGETLTLQSEGTQAQLEELMSLMEEGVEVTQKTPLKMGVTVNGWRIEESQFILDVGSSYYKLEPTTQVLIRAAIVRTVTQIEGISHVMMTVDGEALTDQMGNPVGTMSADSFIDNAGDEINTYEKAELKLYFADESGTRLVESQYSIVFNSNISLERLVMEELVKGPTEETDAYPVLNPETKVLGVTVKDGICYVNLDNNFLTQVYPVTGEVVIYSIVNSLIELPNVNKVQIIVNGESDLKFRETFHLNTIFERNLGLVNTGEESN